MEEEVGKGTASAGAASRRNKRADAVVELYIVVAVKERTRGSEQQIYELYQ